MESGHPEERIREKLIAMETVYFVEKRLQGLSICGGNAEHPKDTRISVTSDSCKSDTKNTINQSVSGILELSRQIWPPYQIQSI
eukprot:9389062-Heterocapsa_arctica.AAC.1